MKIRTMRILTKDGLTNIVKNKWMSFASMSMVMFSLMILGLVLLLAVNIRQNFDSAKQELELVVFLEVKVAPLDKINIEDYIKMQADAGLVLSWRYESKEEAFEEMKTVLEEATLLKGLTAQHMPESFYLKLADPATSDAFITSLKELPGIRPDGIDYPKEALERLNGVVNLINVVTIVVLFLMVIISVFIISNTIRLTVYARKREIEIMKYVGARDGFIRFPFIIEGLIIGIFGGLMAFAFTSQLYAFIQKAINSVLMENRLAVFQVVDFSTVAINILIIYLIFGMSIGGSGSMISVRKHLNV